MGLQGPHGLVAGNRVQLEGFGESFLNGKAASVVGGLSDQYVEMVVDTSGVGQLPPGQTLRFVAPGVRAATGGRVRRARYASFHVYHLC